MPRIGLLSDSHGRALTTRRAVALLREHDAQILLHLGDVGTVEVIDELVVHDATGTQRLPSRLVFGNTDWDRASLGRYAASLGVMDDHPIGRLAVESGVLAFTHGDDAALMAAALAEGVRYLCHGHTHRASDARRGPTRIINPGALFRARQYSVAILDTARDEVRFFPVPEE